MSQALTPVAHGGGDPATSGRRFAATLVTTGIGVAVIGVGLGIGLVGAGGLDIGIALIAVYYVAALVALVVKAASPGQLVLGLVTVDAATGQPSGGKAVAKGLLMGLASSLTCSIGALIGLLIVTPGTNQHLFDKLVGVRVVRRSAGPAFAPPAAAVAPSPALAPSSAFLGGSPVAPPAPTGPPPAAPPVAAPPAVPPPPSAPAFAPAQDLTMPGFGLQTPPAPAPVPDPPAPTWRMEVDQGSVLPMDRSWVIGRAPVPPPSHPDAEPFAIVDATRSLSKTHLVVALDGNAVRVTDLHSTNGVAVAAPGAAPQPLVPGVATVVTDGSVLSMGQRQIVVRR